MNINRYGKWALVTGSSSGLGREFAIQLAANGFNCVLVGLEGGQLDVLSTELAEKYGIECRAKEIDLGSDRFLNEIRSLVDGIAIDVLVNNAGICAGGDFWSVAPERIEMLVKLNCLAPVLLTREFLPGMVQRKRGAVVVVASIMGLITAPGETAYNASKAFDLHFGESLWGELYSSPVDVITVCPAGIKTDFYRRAGFSPADQRRMARLSVSPEKIVAQTLKNLGKKPVYMPISARFIATAFRFLPRRLMTITVKFLIAKYLKFYG